MRDILHSDFLLRYYIFLFEIGVFGPRHLFTQVWLLMVLFFVAILRLLWFFQLPPAPGMLLLHYNTT